MSAVHLAQLNIGRLRWPVDDPRVRPFVEQLDAVNALAESTPGFVWRLTAEGGAPSSYVRADEDPLVIVNLTVWASVEAFRAFTYGAGGAHAAVLRRRREWFERMEGATSAMWWIAAGARPTLEEARARLAHLRAHGPTPYAFTLAAPFPAPDAAPGGAPA